MSEKTFMEALNPKKPLSPPKQKPKASMSDKLAFVKTRSIRVATRESPLAVAQASRVISILKAKGFKQVEILKIKTEGDEISEKKVSEIGGKSVFVKELEDALMKNKAEIAIHSLKDMSVDLDPNFTIAAYMERDSAQDVLVSRKFENIDQLAKKVDNKVGTSSPRRIALLKKYYPSINCTFCRGNLNTRVEALNNGEFDGLILAEAGLQRLRLEELVKQAFSVEDFIPAVGQGIIAVECLSKNKVLCEVFRYLLNHAPTEQAAQTERLIAKELGVNCGSRFGAHANFVEARDSAGLKATRLAARAFASSEDGSKFVVAECLGIEAKAIASKICEDLKSQSIKDLL